MTERRYRMQIKLENSKDHFKIWYLIIYEDLCKILNMN